MILRFEPLLAMTRCSWRCEANLGDHFSQCSRHPVIQRLTERAHSAFVTMRQRRPHESRVRLPNMRLKLPGGDRFKGSGMLCAGAHELSFSYTARGGRVARSLSAIR